MYLVSNGQFYQLSFNQTSLDVVEGIEDKEIALTGNYSLESIQSMQEEEKEKLRSEFRKIKGVLFDTGVNDHGFAMSAKALEHMVAHFNRTIDVPFLHNFFTNHDFMNVDAMLGRQVKLTFDEKTQQMFYEALISNKHPTGARAELMKSVSGTIIRGALECNQVGCDSLYTSGFFPEPTCEHIPNGSDVFPITHKAIHIETSFVTFPAYKKTSVEVQNIHEKYANSTSFSAEKQGEFPDIPDEKSKLLASLQSNDIANPELSEEETEKIAKDRNQVELNSKFRRLQILNRMAEKAVRLVEKL